MAKKLDDLRYVNPYASPELVINELAPKDNSLKEQFRRGCYYGSNVGIALATGISLAALYMEFKLEIDSFINHIFN